MRIAEMYASDPAMPQGVLVDSFLPPPEQPEVPYAKDAAGHEHAPEGTPEGGQFVSREHYDKALESAFNEITGGNPVPFKDAQKALKSATKKIGKYRPAIIDLNNPSQLAESVHAVAKQVPDSLSGAVNKGDLRQSDSHKPLITDVYEVMKPHLGNASLEQFKAALLKAHLGGVVELSREDLPHAVKGDDPIGRVAKSEIPHLGATYHKVDTNSRAARKSLDTPAAK